MKKINILNMIVSFLVIAIYLFLFFKNGSKLIQEYDINLFYKGMVFGITLFMFSMLKFIREGYIMDIIYIIYMAMFVMINFFANIFGKGMEIQVLFMNYPFYIKYVLIVMILINIIAFVRTIKKDSYSENV